MKHYILSMIALATVVIGCTKSSFVDVPEAQKTPIAFDTYTGKAPMTKATSQDKTTLQAKTSSTDPAFHVKAFYGSDLYMNEPVWYDGNKWEYANTIYWPASGTLAFYAYGNSANLTKPENPASTEFTYTVPSATSAQDDLLVAVPIPEQVCTTAVTLNFQHLLSRVGFKLTTTTESTEALPISVTIKSLVLNGEFYESGIVDIKKSTDGKPRIELAEGATRSVPAYSLFDTPVDGGSYSFVTASPGGTATDIFANTLVKNDVSTSDEDDSDRFMMLIPGGIVKSATVEYQLPGQTSSQTVTGTLTDEITLGAGLAYEFIIHLSTDVMEFSGTVTKWDDAEEVIPTPAN